MKRLERPSGYFETYDPVKRRKIAGETRSCVHCGFTWIYNPKDSFDRRLAGNPVIRGKCYNCQGFVCAQAHCLKSGCKPLLKRIEEAEANYRKTGSGILLLGG